MISADGTCQHCGNRNDHHFQMICPRKHGDCNRNKNRKCSPACSGRKRKEHCNNKQNSRKEQAAEALVPTMDSTNVPICRASPIPFKVQANISIPIAGIISLKPSTKLSMNPLNVTTFRGRYKNSMTKTVTMVAKIRLVSASHPANALTTSVAPPRNPV